MRTTAASAGASTAAQSAFSKVPQRDRVAVVTGASRGIGRAIALRLAADGFIVAVHFGQDGVAAQATVATIQKQNGQAFAFRSNLSDHDGGEQFWASFDGAADEAGLAQAPVHTVVNNAGVTARGTIEELSREDFLAQQAINVNAPYLIIKSALPRVVDDGRIINISSASVRVASPQVLAYTMTKAALEALTLALSKHLGHRGITVNAVRPGAVDSDMNADWLRGNDESVNRVIADTALGRLGEPQDVADVVAFLASPDSRWITGQTIDASGGAHL